MRDEMLVIIWGYAAVVVITLILCITLGDMYEKKKAFEAGLCQEMAIGATTAKWQKCK